MSLYTERQLVNGFVCLSSEGCYMSNLNFDYEPNTFVEWVYINCENLKKSHYRESACGIAYRYYIPDRSYRSAWGMIGNDIDIHDRLDNFPMYTKMLAQVQLWEDKYPMFLESWKD